MSTTEDLPEITIYTDGSCLGNPGPGGWAAILLYGDKAKKIISGGCKDTSNNRMELMAAIRALRALKKPCNILLYSDSTYLVNSMENRWAETWERTGWKTTSHTVVKNQDIWKLLIRESKKHDIHYIWIKSHKENDYNNTCDILARGEAAKIALAIRETERQKQKEAEIFKSKP